MSRTRLFTILSVTMIWRGLRRESTGKKIGEFLNAKYGEGTVQVEIADTYYNMGLRRSVRICTLMDVAAEAFAELGIEIWRSIRSAEARMDRDSPYLFGLPCPNLCTGGHNYHGKYEFICIQSMEKTVELLLKIAEKFTKVEEARHKNRIRIWLL